MQAGASRGVQQTLIFFSSLVLPRMHMHMKVTRMQMQRLCASTRTRLHLQRPRRGTVSGDVSVVMRRRWKSSSRSLPPPTS